MFLSEFLALFNENSKNTNVPKFQRNVPKGTLAVLLAQTVTGYLDCEII